MAKGDKADWLLKLRDWTYRRQYLGRSAETVQEALTEIGGVYSSHPSAPLALWARSRTFSPEIFRDLEAKREAVRVPAMRGSIFLMSIDQAANAFATMALPEGHIKSRLDYAGVRLEDYPALKAAILNVATQPLSPEQIRVATGENSERIATVARVVCVEGDMLRVGSASLKSNSLSYVSAAAWGVDLHRGIGTDEALIRLAERYLSAFGPARIKDFQWWAGVTKTRATQAIEALDTVQLADEYWLLQEDLAAFEQVEVVAEDALDILPKWDSYTMGFAPDGRQRFIDPAVQDRIYINVGDGLGIVMRGGKAIGAWASSFAGKKMNVRLDLFDTASMRYVDAIEERFKEVSVILGGSSVGIEQVSEPLTASLGFNRKRKSSKTDDEGA